LARCGASYTRRGAVLRIARHVRVLRELPRCIGSEVVCPAWHDPAVEVPVVPVARPDTVTRERQRPCALDLAQIGFGPHATNHLDNVSDHVEPLWVTDGAHTTVISLVGIAPTSEGHGAP
jgi:hypothetical protein